jgi:hypothetical protein
LRLSKAISACAVSALAMVFSVQQGEHGPLVVYKLAVPPQSAPAVAEPADKAPGQTAPATVPLTSAIAPAPKLSPLKPRVLGSVTLPARPRPQGDITTYVLHRDEPTVELLPSAPESGPTLLDPLSFSELYRQSLAAGAQEDFINQETGEALTLQEVNEEIVWRRDTTEKLRQLPVGPRF